MTHDHPTAAGIYDYLLGGNHHTPVDREAADRVLKESPESADVARRNRDFLIRAVRHIAGQGVTQFLDIGSGLPTGQNVHQVAQQVTRQARTVYVDHDERVLPRARAVIGDDPCTAYAHGDLTLPREILRHPDVQRLIDFSRPIGLLIVSVLHHIPDRDDPYGVVAELVDELPPGSFLALSHSTLDRTRVDQAVLEQIEASNATMATPVTFRDRDQVARFFGGLHLVDPGLVYVEQWAPGCALPRAPIPFDMFAGVATKEP